MIFVLRLYYLLRLPLHRANRQPCELWLPRYALSRTGSGCTFSRLDAIELVGLEKGFDESTDRHDHKMRLTHLLDSIASRGSVNYDGGVLLVTVLLDLVSALCGSRRFAVDDVQHLALGVC